MELPVASNLAITWLGTKTPEATLTVTVFPSGLSETPFREEATLVAIVLATGAVVEDLIGVVRDLTAPSVPKRVTVRFVVDSVRLLANLPATTFTLS